jgi:hypothetical protein
MPAKPSTGKGIAIAVADGPAPFLVVAGPALIAITAVAGPVLILTATVASTALVKCNRCDAYHYTCYKRLITTVYSVNFTVILMVEETATVYY